MAALREAWQRDVPVVHRRLVCDVEAEVIILAIDPGTTESAYVLYDAGWPMILAHGKVANAEMRCILLRGLPGGLPQFSHVSIEMMASYGMPVGREVFETVLWVGRFYETWIRETGNELELVYRKDVKMHLCHQTAKVNDAVIRQALIDRFGGKDKAIGNKAKPGPLYGIKADRWAALAVAVTVTDKHALRAEQVISCDRCGHRRSKSMGCPDECKEAA